MMSHPTTTTLKNKRNVTPKTISATVYTVSLTIYYVTERILQVKLGFQSAIYGKCLTYEIG